MNTSKIFYYVAFIFLIIFSTSCTSTQNRESTGEYIDDVYLTSKVKAEIFKNSALKSSEINVETFKGTVQLSGFVNSQEDIDKAEEITRKIKGVNAVDNSMLLKSELE